MDIELFQINMMRIRRDPDPRSREIKAGILVEELGLAPGLDRLAQDCMRGIDMILAPRGDGAKYDDWGK